MDKVRTCLKTRVDEGKYGVRIPSNKLGQQHNMFAANDMTRRTRLAKWRRNRERRRTRAEVMQMHLRKAATATSAGRLAVGAGSHPRRIRWLM
jgi:hypothetical protein